MARKSSHRPTADKPDPGLDATAEIDETSKPDQPVDESDQVAASDEADVEPDGDAPGNDTGESTDDEADGETDDETDGDVDVDGDVDGALEAPADRSLWEDVRIDPVEIALPAGVGFTLRAYRLSTELTPTDVGDRDEDDPFVRSRPVEVDDDGYVIIDEDFAEDGLETASEAPHRGMRGRPDETAVDDEGLVDDEEADNEAAAGEDEIEEEDDTEAESEAEEVPVFLSHRGRLLLFKSPESLASFVRSGAPNDLIQLDGWPELAERIQPVDVAPLDEDSYELDLVVENLRGGHDTWDPTLLIEAGEVARDLAYALRLPAVLDMLSAGSSLDDLDEALRATVKGGIGGFIGRRRLRKIGAQTASLGWRTIIGKISAVVDWRD